jgi:peptidyl-tRNA hydrolase
VVRDDLPRGVLAAQLIHAAGESSPGGIPDDTHAVALAARDEASLLELEARLLSAGVVHHAVREPDEPWCGALMAIGFPPQDRVNLRRLLSSLPLLR